MWTVWPLCTAILAARRAGDPPLPPQKNKKGRKKENSSGRAAPQGSPALPARLCVGRR